MSKKAGLALLMAVGIGGLFLSYVLWGWTGLIAAAFAILLIVVSVEIESRVRKRQDQDTARKYGAYGEVEPSNYPLPDTHDSQPPTDEPNR